MKGREVYDLLKTRGIDPEVLKVLVKQAEDLHALTRTIPQMAQAMESLSSMLGAHTMILGGMQDHIKAVQKRFNDVRSLGTDEG